MANKKNIDRLFQEKFKDFEVTPNSKVWHNIKNELEKKKKRNRKTIPLWFKYSGIAAVLLLFLALGFGIKNNSNSTTNSVVNIQENDASKTKTVNNNITKALQDSTESSKNYNTSISSSSEENKKNTSYKVSKSKPSSIIINKLASSKDLKNSVKNKTTQLKLQNNAKINSEHLIVKSEKPSIINERELKELKNKAFKNNSKTERLTENTKSKNSKLENIAVTKDTTTTKDSTAIGLTIEQALAKNDDVIEKEKLTNKWSVNAVIAPVYYNSLGKGSHIDQQFVNNKKNGEINTSYGINVGYALNKKLSIRSGVNKLDLSYDTANVLIINSVNTPSTRTFKNVNLNVINPVTTESFAILNGDELNVQQTTDLIGTKLDAALSQRISYFEIPLEVEYKLVNKRFGINLITGFSSFIASNNELVSEISGNEMLIGKANNINTFSFSTNLGIGVDYKFSENFKFNLEPTFKYQINAFSETSGNFNPYIIGVYTGFSYKF